MWGEKGPSSWMTPCSKGPSLPRSEPTQFPPWPHPSKALVPWLQGHLAPASAAGVAVARMSALGAPSPARPGPHLRSTPPSRDALRHSGGERRLCTSATVTLYLEVELSSERRPGTEQKTSLGFTTPPNSASLLMGMEETALALDLDRDTGPAEEKGRGQQGGQRR